MQTYKYKKILKKSMLDANSSELRFSKDLRLYNLFSLVKGKGRNKRNEEIDTFTQFREFKTDDFSLPECLDELIHQRREDMDKNTMRGYLGEYCSRELVELHLRRNLAGIRGVSINALNKKGYVIGVNGNRALKASNDENVVLVEGDNSSQSRKNGFRVVSEVDGMYCITSRINGDRVKEYVIVESKTGTVGLDYSHVFSNVILPYQEILESPIHYVLVDFRRRLFNKRGRRKLKETLIKDFYSPLTDRIHRNNLERRVSIGVIDFPFSEEELDLEVERGSKIQDNKDIVKRGVFDRETGEGHIVVGDKTVYGRFVPY